MAFEPRRRVKIALPFVGPRMPEKIPRLINNHEARIIPLSLLSGAMASRTAEQLVKTSPKKYRRANDAARL